MIRENPFQSSKFIVIFILVLMFFFFSNKLPVIVWKIHLNLNLKNIFMKRETGIDVTINSHYTSRNMDNSSHVTRLLQLRVVPFLT